MAGSRVEQGIDFPAAEGGTSQQTAVHHFDRLHDVKATPVAATEGIGAGDRANEVFQRDVAILESGFG